jgi:predicted MPP superfamily phosphohydrolase
MMAKKAAPQVKVAQAVYDLHYPKHHKPTTDCILEYAEDTKPDVFVFGGDQFHFDCISHHTKQTPIFRTRRAYKNDIEGFDKDILTPLEAVLKPDCEKVWIIGNHEDWEQDLVNEHPELEDVIGHVNLLQLRERGWRIIPLGHAYKLGKLFIIHGEVLSGIGNQAGMYPSRKAVELYSGNVLAGHTHAPQSFTKVSPVEHQNKWQGHISPIAGNVNPEYLRNRPTAWLNGFNRIEVMSNGQFNYYPLITIDGKLAFGGKIYGG